MPGGFGVQSRHLMDRVAAPSDLDEPMPSKREIVLTALHARLQALAAPVLRGDVLPERIQASGLIILSDGKLGEADVTLSPLINRPCFTGG